MMKPILEGFPDVESFLQSSDNFSSATVRKLIKILKNPEKEIQLRMEPAVIIDTGGLCQRKLQFGGISTSPDYICRTMQNLQFHKRTTLPESHGLLEKFG